MQEEDAKIRGIKRGMKISKFSGNWGGLSVDDIKSVGIVRRVRT